MPKVQMPHVREDFPYPRWKRGKLLEVKAEDVQALLDQGGVLVKEPGVEVPAAAEEEPPAKKASKKARAKK